MPQANSIDVVCPLCGGRFVGDAGSAGQRVECPRCGGKVKLPGATATVNDDDQWLRLDEDVTGPDDLLPQAMPEPIAAKPPQPTSSENNLFNDGSLDEFMVPDLPNVGAMPIPNTGPLPGVLPPLSEEDLEALSGFSTSEDQLPAPVKVTRATSPDDSFRVRCPICESLSYAKISQVGKKIRCGDCHSTIMVPPPPKAKKVYSPDMESAKAFTFQGGMDDADPRPADPFIKSAADLMKNAQAAVEDRKEEDDWTVPSIGDWAMSMVGIFRDPMVLGHWIILSMMAAIPTCIAISFPSNPILVMGLFAGGILFAAICVANGFAILQSVANGEKKVSEWPIIDVFAWIGPLLIGLSAVAVAAGPVWFLGQWMFGSSLATVAISMISLYLLYPFVLLSMLDEGSVFTPFSVEVSKSVTRSAEQWGGLYLSSAILFFVLFVMYLTTAAMSPPVAAVFSITATVAAVFIYFALLGQLAFAIGHAVNAPPLVNDVIRNPKIPD